jgi:hypothetical protein
MKRSWVLLLAGCAGQSGPFLLTPPTSDSRPTRAEAVFRCSERDAEVVLDGVPQGTCEDYDGEKHALALGKRQRRVVVKKPGFSTWESWVEADGTRVVVNVTLVSNGGSTP